MLEIPLKTHKSSLNVTNLVFTKLYISKEFSLLSAKEKEEETQESYAKNLHTLDCLLA